MGASLGWVIAIQLRGPGSFQGPPLLFNPGQPPVVATQLPLDRCVTPLRGVTGDAMRRHFLQNVSRWQLLQLFNIAEEKIRSAQVQH